MNDTKNEIIIQCILLIYEGQTEHKDAIKEKLRMFAKFYKVNTTLSGHKISCKTALNDFILNKKGYIKTIPQLYNSI